MIVGIPKESYPGERRVALTPASVPALIKAGASVLVEAGAGLESGFTDKAYEDKGAAMAASRDDLFKRSDVLLMIRTPGANPEQGGKDIEMMKSGQLIAGFSEPLTTPEITKSIAEKGVAMLSMELVPRITRAQSMDALSSMATVAGYKAVLLAANTLPKMFPMLMTAAGTITPAKVFIVGAGVAGLMAIAQARKLGAVVQAYDVRDVVKEQVESLGAKFVEMELEAGDSEDKGGYAKEMDENFYRKQRELMTRVLAESDVVITTAAIPGRKAPLLVTEEMVKGMQPGSVVVDLAAATGGNCELTEADEVAVKHDVTILGPTNLASDLPKDASGMYSKNITTLLLQILKEGELVFDMEDEVVAGTLVCRDGEVSHPRVKETLA